MPLLQVQLSETYQSSHEAKIPLAVPSYKLNEAGSLKLTVFPKG